MSNLLFLIILVILISQWNLEYYNFHSCLGQSQSVIGFASIKKLKDLGGFIKKNLKNLKAPLVNKNLLNLIF